MRQIPLVLILLCSSTATAKVINVEFKFTPFQGNPAKVDQVETVPGQARVFINNVPIAEQPVNEQEVPVLFDAREVAPAVWVPIDSLGSTVRKGKNTIRIEFEPAEPKAQYRAQLRWASVTDKTTEKGDVAHRESSNQSDEGVDSKQATGKIVFERDFVADFAVDHPWHHYPTVNTLSSEDKQRLTSLVSGRVEAFKPEFAGVYDLLKHNPRVDMSALRKTKCLDKAYAAGARIVAAPSDQFEFVTTGGAAVVVRSKQGNLYAPADPAAFEKIGDEETQMCVQMALLGAYPPRLIVVRTPAGAWEVAD